jgi:acyl-CoA synthetase (AMP-forming)/AMP-acid ligase II
MVQLCGSCQGECNAPLVVGITNAPPTFVKDTLKVSGAQVSPTEIENVLLAHPDKLVADVAVVGVKRGRMSDDMVPMAWVVLSGAGKAMSRREAIAKLEKWAQSRLSKYKWLRGGIEMVDEVGCPTRTQETWGSRSSFSPLQIPKSPTGKVLRRVLQTRANDRVPKTKNKL